MRIADVYWRVAFAYRVAIDVARTPRKGAGVFATLNPNWRTVLFAKMRGQMSSPSRVQSGGTSFRRSFRPRNPFA